MSRKEHEERATHHVHLWLANEYTYYKAIQDALKAVRKEVTPHAINVGCAKVADRVMGLLPPTCDGFKTTRKRVIAYIRTEWEEADLYEANNAL